MARARAGDVVVRARARDVVVRARARDLVVRARERDIVARARALLGTRFRPQGRDPAYGLDCVGLVALAAGIDPVPSDYALRGGDPVAIAALIDGFARRVDARTAPTAAGDVLLLAAAAAQCHLVVWTGAGIVHADAALRRVVERPGPPPSPVLGIWRPNPGRKS